MQTGTHAAAIAAAVLMTSGCSIIEPRDDWSRTDTVLELSWQTINVIDGFQTAEIGRQPGVKEGNPLVAGVIGDNPSGRDAALFFATSGVLHYVVSRALPQKWRRYWQSGTLTSSAFAVYRNCNRYGLLCGATDLSRPDDTSEDGTLNQIPWK